MIVRIRVLPIASLVQSLSLIQIFADYEQKRVSACDASMQMLNRIKQCIKLGAQVLMLNSCKCNINVNIVLLAINMALQRLDFVIQTGKK